MAGQDFAAGQNADNRTFNAEQNRLTRQAATEAAGRGLSGQIATDAARDVAAILLDPNIDRDNKQIQINQRWDNARTAQQIADRANGTNFADIFPGGAANPRAETAQTVSPQTQQQIIDQAVSRIVQNNQGNQRPSGGEGA